MVRDVGGVHQLSMAFSERGASSSRNVTSSEGRDGSSIRICSMKRVTRCCTSLMKRSFSGSMFCSPPGV